MELNYPDLPLYRLPLNRLVAILLLPHLLLLLQHVRLERVEILLEELVFNTSVRRKAQDSDDPACDNPVNDPCHQAIGSHMHHY